MIKLLLFLILIFTGFTQGGKDTFGRQRVAHPFTEGYYNFITSIDLEDWSTSAIGSALVTYDSLGSMAILSVTTNGDNAIIQTNISHRYEGGKSHEVGWSLVVGEPTTGVVRKWGYFDSLNGNYFKLDGSEFSVCSRTYTTGTTVEECITNFNGGREGRDLLAKIDHTTNRIYYLMFQWTGVTEYFIYNDDGEPVLLHTQGNMGKIGRPPIQSANLPVSFEISSTVTGVNATMKAIATAVVSSGGSPPPAKERAIGRHSVYTTTGTTETLLLAVRVKELFNGKPNKTILLPKTFNVSAASEAVMFRFYKNPGLTGGTWLTCPDEFSLPATEYSTDAVITTRGSCIVAPITLFASSTGAAANAQARAVAGLRKLNISRTNFGADSDVIVITVQQLTAATTDVNAGMGWEELR